ncbi:MAG: exodeoxyribonuclease VII large subunit [Bacteroidota bacterium]
MEHLTLLELNQTIKATLDANLRPTYWIVAEIGELRTHQSGHCYLELVEKVNDKIVAKSRATIWSYTYRNLSVWFEGITGESLKKGLKILCNVSVQYHELYGFSLNIKDIDANYTLGERARRRQEIIEQLKTDGVFDLNRELVLPVVAQRIAIISSPSAAGYGDFIEQLEGNSKGYDFQIQLFKATMQGDQSAESIMNALHAIHTQEQKFDVVVLIRGGGSQIDLDSFDNYDLASHIAQFPIPVLTGIGHERDETIADLVAHTKLKTPTAVAEFILGSFLAFEDRLDFDFSRLYQKVVETIRFNEQSLIVREQRIAASSKRAIVQEEGKLTSLRDRLKSQVKRSLQQNVHKVDIFEQALDLLDPSNAFKRGYTLTTLNGISIASQKLKSGDLIETHTDKLRVTSAVKEILERNESGNKL